MDRERVEAFYLKYEGRVVRVQGEVEACKALIAITTEGSMLVERVDGPIAELPLHDSTNHKVRSWPWKQ